MAPTTYTFSYSASPAPAPPPGPTYQLIVAPPPTAPPAVSYQLVVEPAAPAGTAPPPIQVNGSGIEYYVYKCAPTAANPYYHWKYHPCSHPRSELPDIRNARPLFVWSSTTGKYTPVEQIKIDGF